MIKEKGVIRLRKVSSSSIGFTIPIDIINKFNIMPGEYKMIATQEEGKITFVLSEIFESEE